MDMMESYRRAQDGFDAVLAAVRADQWDARSACAEWTVRDVAGHVIWGQHQMRAWATGEDYTEMAGAPGAQHPAVMAGDDSVATWRAAREATVATLTEETLARTTSITGIGEVPLAAVVTLLITDHVAHTWDIGHAPGMDVRLDPALVPVAFDWARANVGGTFAPLAPGGDDIARLGPGLVRASCWASASVPCASPEPSSSSSSPRVPWWCFGVPAARRTLPWTTSAPTWKQLFG